MSASLIRRGLELFNEKDGQKCKQKNSSHKASLMNQINSNKQRVHKQIRRLKNQRGAVKSKTTVKDKHIKYALDEYRKKQKKKKSQLTSNLEYFLSTDYKTQTNHSTKIIKQNSGRRACHQPDLPDTKQEEKSVFTEKEFQKFQKEYFTNL
ncbi:ribosomal protein S19 binding protein 1 [Myxocyprinus asiaticus]|uniref:ribosomal protein S19 binding protein 1 n=1 Tax=Myxocyprinus asiaticus TaxID=70543 RepID=UPI0022223881|nr:ribosomal protein S19 binding protein 1 [Myxocyprinus asiaticus]XP_051562924.1 ribosomal protein S19 binding protein 1 [Myxocyprinus asiaticus]